MPRVSEEIVRLVANAETVGTLEVGLTTLHGEVAMRLLGPAVNC